MAEDLLDRITRELRERKQAARAAYEESLRLQAALDALDAAAAGPPEAAPVAAPPPAAARRRTGGAASRTRAPRGENRRRILETVGERPGASAAEVASVTGIDRPIVASTLAKLAKDGGVERVERPAGGVGFRLPVAPSVFDAPAETQGETEAPGSEEAPADAGAEATPPGEAPDAEADAGPAEGDAAKP